MKPLVEQSNHFCIFGKKCVTSGSETANSHTCPRYFEIFAPLKTQRLIPRKKLKMRFAIAISVAMTIVTVIGVAEYDREDDSSADDAVVHADHLMHQNKRKRKKKTK